MLAASVFATSFVVQPRVGSVLTPTLSVPTLSMSNANGKGELAAKAASLSEKLEPAADAISDAFSPLMTLEDQQDGWDDGKRR